MSDAAPKRRLTSLWLIIALTVTPVAASYLIYYFWPPSRSVNYGELLEPRPLPDARLALADGTPFQLSRLKGKWVLATVDSGACDAYCEKKLLYMRQLRLTQGKEMERVERAFLIMDHAAPRAEALAPYQGTWLIRAGSAVRGNSGGALTSRATCFKLAGCWTAVTARRTSSPRSHGWSCSIIRPDSARARSCKSSISLASKSTSSCIEARVNASGDTTPSLMPSI